MNDLQKAVMADTLETLLIIGSSKFRQTYDRGRRPEKGTYQYVIWMCYNGLRNSGPEDREVAAALLAFCGYHSCLTALQVHRLNQWDQYTRWIGGTS